MCVFLSPHTSLHGFCDPSLQPHDVGDATKRALMKAVYAEELLKGAYADREANFLDTQVLCALRENLQKIEDWTSSFPLSILPENKTIADVPWDGIHEVRVNLEASAARVRARFGGSQAAKVLSCAAHDLRWFDPHPHSHPILQSIGR